MLISKKENKKIVYFEINFLDKYVNTRTYIVDRMKPFIAIDVIFFEAKI